MTAYVTATFDGERVYVAAQQFPRQELLRLSIEPVGHADAEAQRIAALARLDDSLSDVRIDGEEPAGREKVYAVCIECGEAFDDLAVAFEHYTAGCGNEGWAVRPESEAM